MRTNRMQACAAVLALTMWVPACVDEADVSEQEDEAEVEDRDLCLYNATPPATDDSDSLVGATNEVDSEDEANGGCDLHMFRVTAAPPASRARTIEFVATSLGGFTDKFARMWTRTCGNGFCPLNYTVTAVPLTVIPGGCFDPDINTHYCFPDIAYGSVALSATNTITDIRAGMRASDEDDDEVPVTITVSE